MIGVYDLGKKEENKEIRNSILDLLRLPNDNIAIFLEVPILNGGSRAVLDNIGQYLEGGEGKLGLMDEGEGKEIPTCILESSPETA